MDMCFNLAELLALQGIVHQVLTKILITFVMPVQQDAVLAHH